MRKFKGFTLGLIVVGVVLIVVAVGIEVSQLPWRLYFGVQREVDEIPDPKPIVLSGEDTGVILYEDRVDVGDIVTDGVVGEPDDVLPGEDAEELPPSSYVVLGIVKIPKLEVSEYVLEGTGRQMRYGVGHLVGSAKIGGAGNCVLSAHRERAFRHINMLKSGDEVVLSVGDEVYTYVVYESFDVQPTDVWVLDPIEGEEHTLTLITCTPYLVNTMRLIVRARLVEKVN